MAKRKTAKVKNIETPEEIVAQEHKEQTEEVTRDELTEVIFNRAYIGKLGVFKKGCKYQLNKDLLKIFKDEVKEV